MLHNPVPTGFNQTQGDFERARVLETELDSLFQVEFIETNPIPIKTALAMRGSARRCFGLPLCAL